ncbi:MAG: hypothetical protein JETT_3609 [Candidatus Jettenia ecosi]|uniref:Uncharacterized protein n=1 Tax=Candidatus Jettenia ecosi TaxID=2494326 RepID=A0A533Q6B8_9BACT|nr:MAG: hypothetical protein JETT_3609 [Candidatus Jettenia ecosi]
MAYMKCCIHAAALLPHLQQRFRPEALRPILSNGLPFSVSKNEPYAEFQAIL